MSPVYFSAISKNNINLRAIYKSDIVVNTHKANVIITTEPHNSNIYLTNFWTVAMDVNDPDFLSDLRRMFTRQKNLWGVNSIAVYNNITYYLDAHGHIVSDNSSNAETNYQRRELNVSQYWVITDKYEQGQGRIAACKSMFEVFSVIGLKIDQVVALKSPAVSISIKEDIIKKNSFGAGAYKLSIPADSSSANIDDNSADILTEIPAEKPIDWQLKYNELVIRIKSIIKDANL